MDEKKKVVLGDEDFSQEDSYKGEGYTVNPEVDETVKTEEDDDSLLASIMRRRQKKNNQMFDEEKDKELAEEATKNVPPAIIEKNEIPEEERGIESISSSSLEGDYYGDSSKVQEAEYVEGPYTKSKVNHTDVEKRNLRRKRGLISTGILALIFVLLFWFAPLIQKAMFQSKNNSLIFKSQTGFWGPRMGIVEIVLGILAIILTIYTFFGYRKTTPIRRGQVTDTKTTILRRIGLIGALLLPLGITNLFNFSEFRGSDIRFSSFLNGNDLKDYMNVSNQKVSMVGNDVIYDVTIGNKSTSFAINKEPIETVKLIDAKMNPTRVVVIDSMTFQEIIKRGIYSEKEAYQVYKYQAPAQ